MAIDRETRRFTGALTAVDPGATVPTCPDWTAADLVWHHAEVQWFWGSIAGDRLTGDDQIEALDETRPVRPETYPELIGRSAAMRDRLLDAVGEGPDDTVLWSWAAEQTLGFTRRRQAHEALIHRVDAELTAGVDPGPLDAALAADGIDELLRVMWAELPAWAEFTASGGVISLEATDTADTWLLALGRLTGTSPNSGTTYDEPTVAVLAGDDPSPVDAVVRGTAGDLDRWLWNRTGAGLQVRVERSGDSAALTGLAELVAAGVQ